MRCVVPLLLLVAVMLAGSVVFAAEEHLWLSEPIALGEGVSEQDLSKIDLALLRVLGPVRPGLVHGRDALLARADQAPAVVPSLDEARTALTRGEGLYSEFKFALAAEAFAHGAYRLTSVISDLDVASVDELYRARLMEGICWLEAGKAKRAREAFAKLIALRPDYEPDPSLISPHARETFREVAAEVKGSGLATLELASAPAGATAFLDGRERGKTPLTVTQISPGKHQIKLVLPGHRTHRAEVDVAAPSSSTGVVPLQPAAAQRALAEIDRAARSGASFTLVSQELAQLLELGGFSSLILVGVRPSAAPDGSPALLITLLRVDAANKRSAVALLSSAAQLDADLQHATPLLLAETWPAARQPEGAALEAVDFSRSLLGADPRSSGGVARAGEESGSVLTSWWLWTGVAGVVLLSAGAVAAALLLSPEDPGPPEERAHFVVEF